MTRCLHKKQTSDLSLTRQATKLILHTLSPLRLSDLSDLLRSSWLKHPTCANVQFLRSLIQRQISTSERLYRTRDLYSKFGTGIQDI